MTKEVEAWVSIGATTLIFLRARKLRLNDTSGGIEIGEKGTSQRVQGIPAWTFLGVLPCRIFLESSYFIMFQRVPTFRKTFLYTASTPVHGFSSQEP